MTPDRTSASAAPSDGSRKLPDACAAKPATTGPTIWPSPKEAVIKRKNAAPGQRRKLRDRLQPERGERHESAAKQHAAGKRPALPPIATLAVTPTASTMQAMA